MENKDINNCETKDNIKEIDELDLEKVNAGSDGNSGSSRACRLCGFRLEAMRMSGGLCQNYNQKAKTCRVCGIRYLGSNRTGMCSKCAKKYWDNIF